MRFRNKLRKVASGVYYSDDELSLDGTHLRDRPESINYTENLYINTTVGA